MNSSLLFHEEIATDVINAFQEKLLATLADSSKGLAAFRFYLEEKQEIALGLVAQTNNRVSFRPWLLSQPEVLFIPTLEHPDDYHPLQKDQLFCPQATLFCYGKPVLQTALLLPVSCPRLISSKNLTSVDKALWDVPGLAFPALSLECTS
ncbi:hypothetical protein [Brevibacillus laterosporus]|uniref:hypothetical protein n=1 Tax=Brevibacillus laterosporus TaxID=1465 RepID=UPI000839C17E|nr:hypothetical protein [Brevibacillus laterosporus]